MQMFHSSCAPGGEWEQPTHVEEAVQGEGPSGLMYAGCDTYGETLYVVASTVYALGEIIYTSRSEAGVWSSPFVRLVEYGLPAGVASVDCAVTPDGSLHVVACGQKMYHLIRDHTGAWTQADTVNDHVTGGPSAFMGVSCAASFGQLHIVGLGTDRQLYHTFREPNGQYQNEFSAIAGVVGGGPPGFSEVDCTGAGESLHVIALTDHSLEASASHPRLLHTYRTAQGDWQSPYDNVLDESKLPEYHLSGDPTDVELPRLAAAGCASLYDHLEIMAVDEFGSDHHTGNEGGQWRPDWDIPTKFDEAMSFPFTDGQEWRFYRTACAGSSSRLHQIGLCGPPPAFAMGPLGAPSGPR